ncbi:MAG: D-alanyl-D-alanine carboxypeptidase [Oscillospiraceae bacterium]|nr:D-alanyl-D-alanine carboxypeptidase [Oscillospiraceae bacterium]
MRRFVCCVLILALLPVWSVADDAGIVDEWVPAETVPAAAGALDVPAPSVILTERSTGAVLYEKDADRRLAPASVTKVMTLLLTMEAIERGQLTVTQKITVSRAAMSMGGSTAYLHEGEQYTIDEMLKAVTIASANDGSVVLAEAVSGTEGTFVAKMNERAAELGMTNTHFVNCHGLDDPDHYTTARDIAAMSRALLDHKLIKNYTTIWLDSLRDGAFTLANTNRLVRYYDGCTGLKTGTTSKAGSCISASAEREGMELIAVVLGAGSTDDRYESARKMLDYGFASFSLMTAWPDEALLPVPVRLGRQNEVQPVPEGDKTVIYEKHKKALITKTVMLDAEVKAPVALGQKLGEVVVECEGAELIRVPLVASKGVERLTWWDIFRRLLGVLTMSGTANNEQ